jgi:lipopolysaccharide export system permease protein
MIFRRSLIREFSLVAIVVVGVLLAIILTRLLISFLGKAAVGSVLPEAVLGLLAFMMLNYLPIILGLSMFIAILLVLTRSHLDSEMTVWFTTGLSIAAWVRPVLQFCLPVALICAVMMLVISPWSQDQSAEYTRILDSRSDVSQVTPGVFRESRQSDRVFFVDKLSERSDVVNNVFVQSMQNNKLGVIVAQRGFQETAENGDTFIVLENGRRYEGSPGTLDYRIVDFQRYALRMEPREAKRESQSDKAKTSMDLLAEPTPAGIAELHWRIAIPIAIVLMALAAIPLSFVNPRAGRSWNLILALLIYFLYYNLLSIFQAWTAQGKIPLLVGIWPVHAAMLVVLAALFSRHLGAFRWLAFGR